MLKIGMEMHGYFMITVDCSIPNLKRRSSSCDAQAQKGPIFIGNFLKTKDLEHFSDGRRGQRQFEPESPILSQNVGLALRT
jgi:hypothetical protein